MQVQAHAINIIKVNEAPMIDRVKPAVKRESLLVFLPSAAKIMPTIAAANATKISSPLMRVPFLRFSAYLNMLLPTLQTHPQKTIIEIRFSKILAAPHIVEIIPFRCAAGSLPGM